jgi:hypothetical protein
MPFAGKTHLNILKLISQGTRPHRRDEPALNDETWQLIQYCWAQMASERPGMKDVAEWMGAIRSLTNTSLTSRSFKIHHLLVCETHRPDLVFNLTSLNFSPMQIIHGRRVPLRPETLAQPATYPPIYRLQIVCDEIPQWPITLEYDDRKETGTRFPYAPPISLGDALSAIHRMLQEPITHVDWARLDLKKQTKVKQAYTTRCKSALTGESFLKNQGAKKVDYLLDKVWFNGLIRTDDGPEVLELVVSCHVVSCHE